jgi:hypothetical protein
LTPKTACDNPIKHLQFSQAPMRHSCLHRRAAQYNLEAVSRQRLCGRPNLAQENIHNREIRQIHEKESGFAYVAYFAVPSVFHFGMVFEPPSS